MSIYVGINGEQLGPFEKPDLERMRREKNLSDYDLVWMVGMADWKTVLEVFGPTTPPPLPQCGKTGYKDWLWTFISIEGRNARGAHLARCIGISVFTFLATMLLALAAEHYRQPAIFILMLPTWIIGAGFLGVSSIRRLHDFGADGRWASLLLVPFVNVVVLGILLLKKGNPSANRFGPRP